MVVFPAFIPIFLYSQMKQPFLGGAHFQIQVLLYSPHCVSAAATTSHINHPFPSSTSLASSPSFGVTLTLIFINLDGFITFLPLSSCLRKADSSVQPEQGGTLEEERKLCSENPNLFGDFGKIFLLNCKVAK